jgi:hypothetical protein
VAALLVVCAIGCDRPSAGRRLPPGRGAASVDAGLSLDAGVDARGVQTPTTVGPTSAVGPVSLPPPPPPLPPPTPSPPLCQMTMNCDGEISDEPKVTCTFSLTDGQGVTEFDDHAGVELHGRSSLKFPKKNYSIELRDAAGANKATDLLGMGQESDWILDGMWADRSLMRNALVYDAFREMGDGHDSARGRYCTLSLNGEALGVYRIEERIKRDPGRVDISADDGTGKSFIIKQESGGAAILQIGQEPHWKVVYPNQDKASSEQIAGVQAWLDALGHAFDHTNDPDIGLLTLLDRDAAVDWMLVQELMKNIDGYAVSIYFSRDAGRPARLIPWDFDLSLGQPTLQDDMNVPTNDQPSGWITHKSQLWAALKSVPAIVQELGPRWRVLRAGPLATGTLLAQLDAYGVTLTADAVAQNFELWPLAQINYEQINAPYSLYPVSSYADEVSKVRAFLLARLDWIDAHVDAFPN